MGYYTTSDNTRVYFQNGMDNHAPDAKASSALLADLLKQPVGAIINDSHGIGGDVKEYLPNMLSTKDVLNEYTYRKLGAQGACIDRDAYRQARDRCQKEKDQSSNS